MVRGRIRITGFLVPREKAVVTLDMPGYKVSEVVASEGDRVSEPKHCFWLKH
jgi:hypothetical protein